MGGSDVEVRVIVANENDKKIRVSDSNVNNRKFWLSDENCEIIAQAHTYRVIRKGTEFIRARVIKDNNGNKKLKAICKVSENSKERMKKIFDNKKIRENR